MQLLRVKCTVKKYKLEAIIFVEKWTELTQNMHIGNTDKIYFLFDFSDLCGLHFDALHFLPSTIAFYPIWRYTVIFENWRLISFNSKSQRFHILNAYIFVQFWGNLSNCVVKMTSNLKWWILLWTHIIFENRKPISQNKLPIR